MTKHPFRVAIETGASKEKSGQLYWPNVVRWALTLTKRDTGAGKVLEVIGHAAKVAGPIRYTLEVSDTKQTFLLWKGQSGGFPLEAAAILVNGDDGLIHEVRMLMRSWPVVAIL